MAELVLSGQLDVRAFVACGGASALDSAGGAGVH